VKRKNNIEKKIKEGQTSDHYEPLIKFFGVLLEWEIKEREERIKSINQNDN
jgi:hypothetical protein